MKKLIFGVVALLLAVFLWTQGGSAYNGFMAAEERINKSYSDIQVRLQQASDLLPNAAEIVKGYADREKATFVEVSQARSNVDAVGKLSPDQIANSPELQKKLVDAMANVQKSMVSLQATRENYPELKSNALFDKLLTQTEGSVNRVAIARKDNVKEVAAYNVYVRHFPGKIWAAIFGFSAKPQFTAAADAQNVPKLNMK